MSESKSAGDSSPASAAQAAAAALVNNESFQKLQSLKNEIQMHFNKGEFDNAIQKSNEALALTKQIPPVIGLTEAIQLHINLSTANLHMNKVNEAEKEASNAVKTAEENAQQRNNHPQAVEVLAISLNTQSVAYLAGQKIDEALEVSKRSLTLCEGIYPKADPRLYKPLRTVGLIYEKKGNTSEAEKILVRAYTLIALSVGHHAGEAQLITEDLVALFTRKTPTPEPENAEKYARKNYQGIKDYIASGKELKGVELGIFSDAATRLATLLIRKQEFADAEKLVAEALVLRESPELSGMNPVGIAVSLSQLAGLRDVLGKLDNDVEGMLMKALEIFTRVKGPQSQEVANTLAQLKAVKSKLAAGAGNKKKGISVEDVDSDEEEVSSAAAKTSSPSPAKKVASSPTAKLATPSSSSSGGEEVTADEKKKIASLPANDGIVRMQLANHYFETHKFGTAEILISEAYQIFLKQFGAEHQNTQAAKQNLTVVRNNRLNQLWMQVVAEEVLNFEDLKINDESAPETKSNQTKKSGPTTSGENEYAKIMTGKKSYKENNELTMEEKLFLQSTENEAAPSSNCVIC